MGDIFLGFDVGVVEAVVEAVVVAGGGLGAEGGGAFLSFNRRDLAAAEVEVDEAEDPDVDKSDITGLTSGFSCKM